jgi:4-aminobutyrate aminotransferase-like enzyme
VCIGKSIGGGIPISVIYFRNDYDKALPRAFHLGTYRGNPLALAAGRVVLKEVPNYFERVIRDGESLKDKFQKIDSKLVREVRGRGFMIGLELCRGDTPLSSEDMTNIKLNLLKNGLLMHSCGRFSNVLRFMAPLNTDSSLLNKGSEILAKVLKITK